MASCSGGRSGSITWRRAVLRSWFCSSRAVSDERSTSASTRSVAKPAMRTRRKDDTSSLLWSGVSTGTSTNEEQPPAASAARMPIESAFGPTRTLLGLPALALAISLVIGFPEKIVVLLDIDVVRLELERAVVGGAGLVELSLLLEGDREVV